MFADSRMLVTGASGFVGGALVHALLSNGRTGVRALVRNPERASRIASSSVELRQGSITDEAVVDEAVKGCEVVFHCAHDFQDPEQNLVGAHLLGAACVRHKARRLVYVSSASVYEPLPEGDLTENSPAEPCGAAYPDNKLKVEKILNDYADGQSLSVVILQPSIIYGAFSPWTVITAKMLRERRLVLPSDRQGLCNAVYIKDMVQALILAAEKEGIGNERFLISGPDVVTWREYFGRYEEMLKVNSVILIPTEEIERLNRARDAGLTSEPAPTGSTHPLLLPDAHRLAFYSAPTTLRIDKARRLLGYEPSFDFERGMSLTAQFVASANL